jgi:hypothetical protein
MKEIQARTGENYKVLMAGLLATFLPVIFYEAYELRLNEGHFIYPVDDVYIHMQLGRNLAFQHTWGMVPGVFAPASSSLLYTLLLAFLFKIFSLHAIIPFIINCLAGIALVTAVGKWLQKQQLPFRSQLLVMLLMVICTPLPVMIISGMEHTLQCLFAFLFLFASCEHITVEDRIGKRSLPWKLALYGLLLTLSRYEGLFLVGLVCLAFAYYRRWAEAFFIGFVAVLPVLVFGIYSLAHGAYFFPNSVLVKAGEVSLFGGGLFHFFQTVLADKLTFSSVGITGFATQRLLLLLPLTALIVHRKARPSYRLILLLLALCTFIHLAFASTGKFYRYEAYLMACSFVIMSAALLRYGREWWPSVTSYARGLALLLAFFLLIPVGLRLSAAYSKAGRACVNIYQQQYQMARFLKQYYPHATVAANDIGAISYYTDVHVIDLVGLGTNGIADSKIRGYVSPAFLDSFSRNRGATIAIIYDSWFDNAFTTRWRKLATWQIQNNVIAGDDTVSFYAIDSSMAGKMLEDLHSFSGQLPQGVTVQYFSQHEKE